ncbi:hypothetical protein KW850_10480 [Bacillus sp. sid0103]|uniref:hypothetical protein n=1 Tax=Bacillus sp. sid0103 TaxID=2856337 RepID=UPI001C49094A|nr:hypothetical protein [Bacillus sp. sid0103]MBV7505680.1 hypothetical protein [Bacillus sp. sid0103]
MKRKFFSERGAGKSPQVRKPREVLYAIKEAIEEAIEIFIRAKTAEGVRPGTLIGYHDNFRYFRQWLEEGITDINEIKFSPVRNIMKRNGIRM